MPKVEGAQDAAWLGLQDWVCVVTGGGSGIGAETARLFASAGAKVAVVDRDAASATAMATGIESNGGRAIAVVADVGRADTVRAAAYRVRAELGPCRVLVNNAAQRHRGPLLEIDLADWNGMLAANLTGALVCTQAFAAQMVAAGQGGSIVHVASILGHHPQPLSGAYSVSKAGLIMLSRLLALELGEHRIRSNVVSPGFTRTPHTEASYRDTEVAQARERMIPAGRVAGPEDMAQVIAFLASDRSGYVDAQDIVVDGGLGSSLMTQVPRSVQAPKKT